MRVVVGAALLALAAAQEAAVPDPEVGRLVDAVAARFVAANGRGFEGWEPKQLKAAARAYHDRLTPLPMPWPRDPDSSESFSRPADEARIPNIAHWAWRSGDADWTLALSVVMARAPRGRLSGRGRRGGPSARAPRSQAAVVQRPESLMLHTGPLGPDDRSYVEPRTAAGRDALRRADRARISAKPRRATTPRARRRGNATGDGRRCIRAAGAAEVRHESDPTPDPDGRHPWAEVIRRGKRLSKQTFAHVSDVMRLKTILDYGGIYLDRDAFLHKSVDHYRWRHDAVLGLEPSNFERDHAANFGRGPAPKSLRLSASRRVRLG